MKKIILVALLCLPLLAGCQPKQSKSYIGSSVSIGGMNGIFRGVVQRIDQLPDSSQAQIGDVYYCTQNGDYYVLNSAFSWVGYDLDGQDDTE